jgi:hypothetical protein
MSEQSIVSITIQSLKWESYSLTNRSDSMWRASSILGTYTVKPLSEGAELSLEGRQLRQIAPSPELAMSAAQNHFNGQIASVIQGATVAPMVPVTEFHNTLQQFANDLSSGAFLKAAG